MTLSLKEELIKSCDDKLLLDDFFSDIDYLDELIRKNTKALNEDEKKMVNEILDFADETNLTMIFLLANDYYMKLRYKFIRQFIILFNKDFYDINVEYYEMVENYTRRLQKIESVIEFKDELKIEDIKLLYELTFLTFIVLLNDLAIFDYNMLNKNKYKDSDLSDLSNIKSSAKAYELSLITLNRKLKKENY